MARDPAAPTLHPQNKNTAARGAAGACCIKQQRNSPNATLKTEPNLKKHLFFAKMIHCKKGYNMKQFQIFSREMTNK